MHETIRTSRQTFEATCAFLKAILQRATKKHNRNIINSMLNMLKQLITSSLEIGAERYPDVYYISLAEMLSNIMDCPLLG